MYVWDFAALKPYWGLIWQGLGVTIFYTVTTVLAGVLVGLVVGILRTAGPRWVSPPLRAYIEVFRCTPLLVQLIWVYYALPVLIGVDMSAAMACFLTLSLYAGSFYAEIFRGGINAVDRGQSEASLALGMSRLQVMRHIVLPQAVKKMLPAFINQSVIQVKNTSLLYAISIAELTYMTAVVNSETYRPMEAYTLAAVMYFVLLFPLTQITDRIERKMARSD